MTKKNKEVVKVDDILSYLRIQAICDMSDEAFNTYNTRWMKPAIAKRYDKVREALLQLQLIIDKEIPESFYEMEIKK